MDFIHEKPTQLQVVKNVSDSLRYADTLKLFESIRGRVVNEAPGQYIRNNELLAKAEFVHTSILQQLIDLYRKKGYQTMFNRHIDLFAYNEKQPFLIEVKSTENHNFRAQARKGIVQLFEYDYFEIQKFIGEEKISFKNQYKTLITSKVPEDNPSISFINGFEIGVGLTTEAGIDPVGIDLGFSSF